jgi:outer membrane protein
VTAPSKQSVIPTRGVLAALIAFTLGASLANAQGVEPLTLSAALERLPQSPDWQLADLNFSASQRALETALAAGGFNLNAGGAYSLTRQTNDSTGNNGEITPAGTVSSNANLTANASISVLPWSQSAVQAQNAARGLEQAAFDRLDARKSLTLNVTTQYFAARITTKDLDLTKGNEALSTLRLKVATQQQANGQITYDQLLGVQQALETAKVNTLTATNTLELARLTLFNSLGLAPNDAVLSSAPTEYAPPTITLEILLKSALEQRNDVLKATSKLHQAEDALAAAQFNRWLPNSSISLGYGQLGSGGPSITGSLNLQSGLAGLNTTVPVYQNPQPGSNPGLTFSINASIPILAPSQDAQINAAQTNLETARKMLEGVKRNAELDIRQKDNNAVIASQRLAIAKLGLQSARSSLETGKARFASGTITAIDLQSAEQNTKQAERDLENAVVATQTAGLGLQIALGKDVS